MLAEQNREIVRQFYRAFDDRQMERAISLLSPNFVAHLAGIPDDLNRQEFEQFGMSFYLAFSHGKHLFEEVIVAEDKVITCGTFKATHLGEFQGLPPTGKQISLDIMHIDRLEDGKIIEHWGQGDTLGLMQQLGIIFLPGPKLVPQIFKGAMSKLFNRNRSK